MDVGEAVVLPMTSSIMWSHTFTGVVSWEDEEWSLPMSTKLAEPPDLA